MKPIKKVKVCFYLSPIDQANFNNNCALLNIAPSVFLRQLVLEKLKKPLEENIHENLELKKYTYELFRTGNNLNQIAKKLNSGVKFVISDQQKVLDNIKNIITHIIEIKSKL